MLKWLQCCLRRGVYLGGVLVGVDHPTTNDRIIDAPEPYDELRRSHAGPNETTGDTPDLSDIPSPEDYRAAVDAEYRKHAVETGCARIREIEQNEITPALRRIESADPTRHLVGLEHRLKSEDRLTEKVENAKAEQLDLTYEEAFATVKDAVRFTFQYPDNKYLSGYQNDHDRLESAGFELVDRRNTWSNDQYKGVNTRWRVPESGLVFEVQFHTEASYDAKQETHAAYERLRAPGVSKAEQEELMAYQRSVTSRVPVPPGAAEIRGKDA